MDQFRAAQQKKNLIIFGITSLGLLAVGFIVYWFYSHAYLEVSIEGNAKDSSITVLDQESLLSKTYPIKGDSPVKLLMKKGGKEVLFNDGGQSGIVLVKVGSFLGTTETKVRPKSENARQFVGNNPDPCTQLVGGILFSYECNGAISSINLHKPATAKQPTSAAKINRDSGDRSIIGTMTDNTHLIVVSQEALSDGTYSYLVSLFNTAGLLVREVPVGQTTDVSYSAVSYDGGLLLYGAGSSKALKISRDLVISAGVELPSQKDKKLSLLSVAASGSTLVSYYSEEREEAIDHEDHEPNQASHIKAKSELVIDNDGSIRHLSLNERLGKIVLCGEGRLCGLNGSLLRVFDITSNSIKYQYQVTGVYDVISVGSELLLQRNDGIFSLDAATQSGYISYGTTDYRLCGASLYPQNTVLCLINGRNDKMSLMVNRQSTNNDNIDKKVARLLENNSVKSLSVYGSFIYVTPEIGKITFIPELEQYGYDPKKRAAANKDIEAAANNAGIDRSAYQLINTLP